ncbi:hypothetical protein [Staphylococcus caeli]|uniref:hypothetical protein n=1 Tax=Staphylococcus caeli TaxID=2201815 RepID=UPI003F553AC6
MSNSFYIAFAMFLVSLFVISMLTSNAVTGLGYAWMLSILTYVFFEYVFKDTKKTAKRANA